MQNAVSYPVVIPDGYPLIQVQNVNGHCGCQHQATKKKLGDNTLPISLTTMVHATMIMMASIIAICGYIACTDGEFKCDVQNWPDISHIMGVAPRNKLYSIMLTFYSATKFCEARAYHDKLSTFVSPLLNGFLLIAALASFIFGPMIGYWDCYYNMDKHMLATQIFTVGEIIYIYIIVYLISSNRDQFPATAKQNIDLCVFQLYIVTFTGVLMWMGNGELGIHIAQIGEWIAFYSDFWIRYNIAMMIKYTCEVVPAKEA